MANKPRGGGLKALVAGPLRKELVLRLPLAEKLSSQLATTRKMPIVRNNGYILLVKALKAVIIRLRIKSAFVVTIEMIFNFDVPLKLIHYIHKFDIC